MMHNRIPLLKVLSRYSHMVKEVWMQDTNKNRLQQSKHLMFTAKLVKGACLF